MSKNLTVVSRSTRPGVYHRICDRFRVGNSTSLLITRASRRSHRGFAAWRAAPRSSPSPSEIRDSGLVTVLPLPCPPLGAETFASPNSGCTPAATGRRQRMFGTTGRGETDSALRPLLPLRRNASARLLHHPVPPGTRAMSPTAVSRSLATAPSRGPTWMAHGSAAAQVPQLRVWQWAFPVPEPERVFASNCVWC